MLMGDDVAGMWLNNGKRLWEKESSFSRNGSRQSHFGELLAAAGCPVISRLDVLIAESHLSFVVRQ